MRFHDRRQLLALMGAAGALGPSRVLAQALRDQPSLPRPLDAYLAVPVQDISGAGTTLGRLVDPPRPTVISFWATWCAPCAIEGRHLASLRARYPESRLAMVGINVDAPKDLAKAPAFRQRAGMNYAQAFSREAYVAVTGSSAVSLPRTYVFDRQGRPMAAFGRFYGDRTTRAITAAVERALVS